MNAQSKAELDAKVEAALAQFRKDVGSADMYLKESKGVLVMPDVGKAALLVGGEYGRGALRIDGKDVAYYRLKGGSLGLAIGAEKFDMILVFLSDEALAKFRESRGWKVGADAAVTVVKSGAETDTFEMHKPILAFIVGQKGLLAGISVEGVEFSPFTSGTQ